MNTFNDIKELLSTLKREEKLISEMFRKRKKLDYKFSDALELVENDENKITALIQKSVIRENGNYLELDDQYLDFFETVLYVSEEINLSYIDDNIKTIKENIDYFLNENNENKKYNYLRIIKRIFRKIGFITLKSVVDLMRNIETTFKNEANYKNKKLKLENLDEKRTVLENLIKQTLLLINQQEHTFFNRALDEELKRIIIELKYQLSECSHNLIDIEKQIIDFLNQIKIYGKFLEKLRKLKYLKDNFTIEVETDVKQILATKNQVIFETKILEPLNLSLHFLQNDEKVFENIKRIAKNHQERKFFTPVLADKISDEFLKTKEEEEIMINLEEVRNQFLATSNHLFDFVMNYNFGKIVDFNERVTIFCQIATQYALDLKIASNYQTINGVEFTLIYPK